MGKHSEWRKIAKKTRRKRIRQKLAQERCVLEEKERKERENSPSYHQWLEKQKLLEDHRLQEEEELAAETNRKWVEAEKRAQQEWKLLQDKIKLIKEERAKHQALIRAEWEKEQKRLKDLEEKKVKEEEKKQKQQLLLKEQLENFIENGGEIPEYLKTFLETNPNKPVCPFFKKIGSCRFGDACSRNHQRPSISNILLISNFYSHMSLEQSTENEHGSNSLEFESHERYSHFKEFFYDVLPELEKCGQIKQFKVCCNEEPHLRGNVYVEYSTCREAMIAYRIFQARWYGGKQLNVDFCGIDSWKNAICGLYFKKACPKGSACNFLHVFRNPGSLYHYIEREPYQTTANMDIESNTSSRNWRWSESPERLPVLSTETREIGTKYRTRENGVKRKSRRRSISRSKSKRHTSRSSHRKSHKRSKT